MKKPKPILLYILGLLCITCEPDKPQPTDLSSKISVTTDEIVSNITLTSATVKGNIVDDGGYDITQSGVCWSTNENPTINDTKQIDDIKLGEFTVTISGLSSDQVYYIRAYAQHSWGNPSYGNQVSFKTLKVITTIPIVTTTSASGVTSTSAQSGGNVTDDGGDTVTARGVCWNILPNPTTANLKIVDPQDGKGVFTSYITDLSPNTEYHVRAFAINSKGTGYGEDAKFTTTAPGFITDIDDNNYKIVKIGNQWWMAENLKTTRYADGTAIPLIENNTDWTNLTYGAMCYYDNSDINKAIYGGLYNWPCTINNHQLCPSGWHVPSDADWKELIQTLGPSVAGIKLKEAGDTHWKRHSDQDNLADNSTGFTALPGGTRKSGDGTFLYQQTNGFWWSATDSASGAFNRNLWTGSKGIDRDLANQKSGFSIRCVKD